MGNGLGIKKRDLHGLSGSGFRSENILTNINKNTEVDFLMLEWRASAVRSS